MSKFLENISEIIGWFQIAISPALIGTLVGVFIYYSNPSSERMILGILVGSIGLIVGILLAIKIYKSKKGTIWFLSRTSASSD